MLTTEVDKRVGDGRQETISGTSEVLDVTQSGTRQETVKDM